MKAKLLTHVRKTIHATEERFMQFYSTENFSKLLVKIIKLRYTKINQ